MYNESTTDDKYTLEKEYISKHSDARTGYRYVIIFQKLFVIDRVKKYSGNSLVVYNVCTIRLFSLTHSLTYLLTESLIVLMTSKSRPLNELKQRNQVCKYKYKNVS